MGGPIALVRGGRRDRDRRRGPPHRRSRSTRPSSSGAAPTWTAAGAAVHAPARSPSTRSSSARRRHGRGDLVSAPGSTTPAALECRECGAAVPGRAAHDLRGVLRPARARVRPRRRVDGDDFRKQAEAGPEPRSGATSRSCPAAPTIERVDLRRRIHAAAAGGPARPSGSGWRSSGSRTTRVNPSNSFKDRVVSVAVTMARAFGFEAIIVRLDGQPRERHRGARREGGHAVLRVRARGPRAREDPRHRGLRREGRRGQGATTTT